MNFIDLKPGEGGYITLDTWLEILYWLVAVLFLYLHPKRHFGQKPEYPGYQWYHTALKITPYLIASYLRSYQVLVLALADTLFDGRYLTGKEVWFNYGLAFWTLHHFLMAKVYYPTLNLRMWIISIGTLAGIELTDVQVILYLAGFALHGLALWSGGPVLGLTILGSGDLLLVASRDRPIPYKDQLTMLSSYLYVWLTFF